MLPPHSSHGALSLLLPDNPPVSLLSIENGAVRLTALPGARCPRGETGSSTSGYPLPAIGAGGPWNGPGVFHGR
ncbi:hypothetical protein [Lentzea sp. NPDC051838]|uniref:hypothetical protein n=1 Tax=Lentzea sp. NPDC051838 TaxID=3154849 RepID=UPI0034207651